MKNRKKNKYRSVVINAVIVLFALLSIACGRKENSVVLSDSQITIEKTEYGGEKNKNRVQDYTWEEFESLSKEEQEIFVESFESIEAFERWENTVSQIESDDCSVSEIKTPWENSERQPSDYTWEEFESLSGEEQELFVESFGTSEAFEAWEQSVKQDTEERTSQDVNEYSWERAGKQPSDYTWEEFEALSGEEQEAFVESFETTEAFREWEKNAFSNE